jgi:uncharacterized protein YbjT (DUF2867 family)
MPSVEPEQPRTYVVTGITGAVGRVVAHELTQRGHQVRGISRHAGTPIDDPAALAAAFHGAAAAFLMIPFARSAPNLHQRETEIASKLAHAVLTAHIRRVVLLSGTSAHLGPRAGSGMGAAIAEQLLDRLDIPERVYLRACFFMENHLGFGFLDQATTGTYATMFRPDRPTPMIAARDVGQIAAQLLTEHPFTQPRVRELLGAADYTMTDATRILGTAIGMPNLRYAHIPYHQARTAMIDQGISPSFTDAVIDTARGFNDGTTWATEQRSATNTTPTTLTAFAHHALRPAFESNNH